jgi:hypothetical protein
LEKIKKEAFVARFEVLFRNLLGGTNAKPGNLSAGIFNVPSEV